MVNPIVMSADRAGKPGSTPPGGPDVSEALRRFRAGEIGVDAYIDQKVTEATAHLAGLPMADLEAVRVALRAQIAASPELRELVRQATRR
jgi:phosphoserine phosphatase